MKQELIDTIIRLGIQPRKWGNSYRVKVRNEYGRLVYINQVSKPSKIKLISRFYKIDMKRLENELSHDPLSKAKIKTYKYNLVEWYLRKNDRERVLS